MSTRWNRSRKRAITAVTGIGFAVAAFPSPAQGRGPDYEQRDVRSRFAGPPIELAPHGAPGRAQSFDRGYGGASSISNSRGEYGRPSYNRGFAQGVPGPAYRVGEMGLRSSYGPPVELAFRRAERTDVTRYVTPGVPIVQPGSSRGSRLLVGRDIPLVRMVRYPAWATTYFPDSYAAYSYYAGVYMDGTTVASPYGCYSGCVPPYISADQVYNQPPLESYIPEETADSTPVEPNSQPAETAPVTPAPDRAAGDSAADPAPPAKAPYPTSYEVGDDASSGDAGADATTTDIKAAWLNGDESRIEKHLRKTGRIAIYLEGKYQYSLDATDYSETTIDAMKATTTVSFQFLSVVRKADGIYTATALHVYQDHASDSRAVKIRYVLEKDEANWVITQVETTPQKAGG